MKNIHVIGGGTIYHIRSHLALSAPAYGTTAKQIYYQLIDSVPYPRAFIDNKYDIHLHLTKMADTKSSLETNDDISILLDQLIADPDTKCIVFNPALVDFTANLSNSEIYSGKYSERLKTSEGEKTLVLTPAEKLVSKIRKSRKDIFLVAFKTTCGATEDEQFLTGLHLLKSSSCNLVLANDVKTRVNMIITPEQARYCISSDRERVIKELCQMIWSRSSLDFTRSTVVEGDSIDWNDPQVPSSLRTVVNYCIQQGAYKPFRGSTVGHFAVKVDDKTFYTSKRKTNFNNLDDVGLVKVESDSPNSVIAYGSKPSVGGQSQRIVFKEHPEMDCIVHFHCMMKPEAYLSVRSQQMLECGSHQCGQNTSDGLREEESGIKCVYLDNHGPNIVFNRDINPEQVIQFIERNFDLSKSTDMVDRNTYQVS